eukprot:10783600-Karenia_brevis.AAC.1
MARVGDKVKLTVLSKRHLVCPRTTACSEAVLNLGYKICPSARACGEAGWSLVCRAGPSADPVVRQAGAWCVGLAQAQSLW